MSSRLIGLAGLLLLLLLANCSRTVTPGSEPPPGAVEKRITSANVVKAEPQRAEIAAGSTGEVVVRLTIDSGYHVNANPPTYPYLKATELEIPSSEGVSLTSVKYPPALNRKFPFAEEPIAIYEGETELRASLKADNSAKKGERSMPAKLHIQACDDQVCYPPGAVDLQLPLTIK